METTKLWILLHKKVKEVRKYFPSPLELFISCINREAINRVSEAAGLKSASKRKKVCCSPLIVNVHYYFTSPLCILGN